MEPPFDAMVLPYTALKSNVKAAPSAPYLCGDGLERRLVLLRRARKWESPGFETPTVYGDLIEVTPPGSTIRTLVLRTETVNGRKFASGSDLEYGTVVGRPPRKLFRRGSRRCPERATQKGRCRPSR